MDYQEIIRIPQVARLIQINVSTDAGEPAGRHSGAMPDPVLPRDHRQDSLGGDDSCGACKRSPCPGLRCGIAAMPSASGVSAGIGSLKNPRPCLALVDLGQGRPGKAGKIRQFNFPWEALP
jgi:hypothetical protein